MEQWKSEQFCLYFIYSSIYLNWSTNLVCFPYCFCSIVTLLGFVLVTIFEYTYCVHIYQPPTTEHTRCGINRILLRWIAKCSANAKLPMFVFSLFPILVPFVNGSKQLNTNSGKKYSELQSKQLTWMCERLFIKGVNIGKHNDWKYLKHTKVQRYKERSCIIRVIVGQWSALSS